MRRLNSRPTTHCMPGRVLKRALIITAESANLSSPNTSSGSSIEEKMLYHKILAKQSTLSELQNSLRNLTEYLFRHTGKKPWLLIDEYDSPIQAAFLNGYYDEMVDLIRGLFSAALKTNPYLEKSVITGILRIAKESLFSGLNNVTVYTLLHSKYSEYFGFTEAEVDDILQHSDLKIQAPGIRAWYNGYLMGETVIYNPWSLANCIQENGLLRPYWVNTSDNLLVKHLLAQGDIAIKEQLESLLRQKPIEASIDENVGFGDIDHDQNAMWGLLLFSGYLKAVEKIPVKSGIECKLLPPNLEVEFLYENMIQGWFSESLGQNNYANFLKSLLRGDVEEFTLRLQDCLRQAMSVFDGSGKHPEKFYHGLALGMMVTLTKTYVVQSNRESGFGRYDVMLIPRDTTQLGIVIEFKSMRDAKTDLITAARQALQQIIDRRYSEVLKNHGISRILELGLAFYGKNVEVIARKEMS